ncbi:PaeR7I family type II restriction endonuclease [Treponema sp.]|uniref:PaeR7I family type II restriction endonuclease n=1 Tax=Treponema sp. TaxID=166 RepID=UPI00298E70CB|nr:PaeR7I family type II restriction endonuclease [Treponema sp.]MCR5613410.1 PaeR7I family type II restriction endonuclease [Treponema sp.]
MNFCDISSYQPYIDTAVKFFWDKREAQLQQQISSNTNDQGNRGAVTGGKQLDGFLNLLKKICLDIGIPEEYILTKNNIIPGYFRPTKDWDFLIITPQNHIVALIELKSQVGSFGNNFNNRTEEALGSAVDFWTSFKWKSFNEQMPPWLGYLMVVEEDIKSISPVAVSEPIFRVRDEFRNTSYLDRFHIFCSKLMAERHYNAASLLFTKKDYTYNCFRDETNIFSFLESFRMYVASKLGDFK